MYALVRDAGFGFKDVGVNKYLRVLVFEVSDHAKK